MTRLLTITGRIAALLLVLFTGGFVVFASLAGAGPAGTPRTADGIVALTGGEDRIDEAVRLLAEGKAGRMLITGVNRRTTRSALERLAPNNHDLFECCIDIGYWAKDTVGNADEAQAWVQARRFGSVIVVTSSYHMPRSLVELRRVMPGVELIPHPVVPANLKLRSWWADSTTARLLFIEYMKLLPAAARLAASRVISTGETASAHLADSFRYSRM